MSKRRSYVKLRNISVFNRHFYAKIMIRNNSRAIKYDYNSN